MASGSPSPPSAAVASALYWTKLQFFPDIHPGFPQADDQARWPGGQGPAGSVKFEPYMAGERTSIEQRQGVFHRAHVATTREQMLSAMIESLATASAARLPLLDDGSTKLLRTVVTSGGASDRLDKLMHRGLARPVEVQTRH